MLTGCLYSLRAASCFARPKFNIAKFFFAHPLIHTHAHERFHHRKVLYLQNQSFIRPNISKDTYITTSHKRFAFMFIRSECKEKLRIVWVSCDCLRLNGNTKAMGKKHDRRSKVNGKCTWANFTLHSRNGSALFFVCRVTRVAPFPIFFLLFCSPDSPTTLSPVFFLTLSPPPDRPLPFYSLSSTSRAVCW